jgi:hypothetical protein
VGSGVHQPPLALGVVNDFADVLDDEVPGRDLFVGEQPEAWSTNELHSD